MARPGDPQEMDERAVVRKIGDAETIRFAADNGDGAALLSLGVWEVVRQAMEEERGFFGAVYAVGGSREYQIWHAFDIAGVDPERWYPTLYDEDGNALGSMGGTPKMKMRPWTCGPCALSCKKSSSRPTVRIRYADEDNPDTFKLGGLDTGFDVGVASEYVCSRDGLAERETEQVDREKYIDALLLVLYESAEAEIDAGMSVERAVLQGLRASALGCVVPVRSEQPSRTVRDCSATDHASQANASAVDGPPGGNAEACRTPSDDGIGSVDE